MVGQKLRFYQFGPFRLDVRERLLLHEGVIVPLTPRLFDTLLVLVENRGRLLEKEFLIGKLWPDSFVTEGSLAQNISLLRKALGEGTSGQYIQTFPKRGYLFTAETDEVFEEEVPEEEGESPEAVAAEGGHGEGAAGARPTTAALRAVRTPGRRCRNAYMLIACAVLTLAGTAFVCFRRPPVGAAPAGDPELKSIAILPFNGVGAQNEEALLGFGIADALIGKMSTLQGLRVLPTSSVYKYTAKKKTAVEIGRELGVDAVLDGTVQRSGDLVRVSAQFTRTADGALLWATRVDKKFSHIFEAHDLVAERLVHVLTQNLTPTDHARLSRRHTSDPDAYEAYVTGVYFWSKRTKAGLTKSIDYFKLAVEKDPRYAPAHAMLADSYYLSHAYAYEIVPGATARAMQADAARKALELDRTLAEARLATATVKEVEGAYQEADEEYRRALELNPSHAVAHLRYSFFLVTSLELDGAVRHMRAAQELAPVSPTANAALGYMLVLSRRYDEAIKFCRRALELDPEVVNGHLNLGEAYLQKGMYEEALDEFSRMPEERRADALQMIACAQAKAGRRSAAVKALSEFQKLPDADRAPGYNLVLIFVSLGEHDRAFAQLEKLRLTRFSIAMLKFDPRLDPLRSDARFGAYIRSRNLGI